MSLQPGTALGPYEVIAQIGGGGMGEVYRARDTKLDRDVARKILPEDFAADPDRLARELVESPTLQDQPGSHSARRGSAHRQVDRRAIGNCLTVFLPRSRLPRRSCSPLRSGCGPTTLWILCLRLGEFTSCLENPFPFIQISLQYRRVLVATLILLIGVLTGCVGMEGPSVAEEDFASWASRNAIVLDGVEPGAELSDLRELIPILEGARVVALGEATHGNHEFLALRNRLFAFLVEELGFTAIAVETGFTEAREVDAYVIGESDDNSVVTNVFHWASEAWEENQQLIDWIREYNGRPSTRRRIRFYGVDLTGGRLGQFRVPRLAVDGSLEYLGGADPDLAERFGSVLEPYLDRFTEGEYETLDSDEQHRLTATLGDLVLTFERERPSLIASSGELDYEVAHRQALDAQRVDAYIRQRLLTPNDRREEDSLRDEMMAANVQWVLGEKDVDGYSCLPTTGMSRRLRCGRTRIRRFTPIAPRRRWGSI